MMTHPRPFLPAHPAARGDGTARTARRRHGMAAARALAACLIVALTGCADAPEPDPVPAERDSVEDLERFPSPPASRSMGAMDEPDARLELPIGAAGTSGELSVKALEGRVFRRVSMVATGEQIGPLLEHYRGLFDEGGYTVLFECGSVEACGGAPLISKVIEGYATAQGDGTRAATVIALIQPTSGELQHFSLSRELAGVDEYLSVTVSRSEGGPLMVVTQQGFVEAEN